MNMVTELSVEKFSNSKDQHVASVKWLIFDYKWKHLWGISWLVPECFLAGHLACVLLRLTPI